ncbi:MAG: hypothetical protein ACR2NR_02660 [Solirubrobacteraceae bacterium]
MRRLALGLLSGVVMLGASPAAAAPVAMSFSASSKVLRYHGAGSTMSIRLRTGPTAETVKLGLKPSRWQDRDMFGSPIRTSDQRITGAGRIVGSISAACCDFAAGVSVCRRGGPPYMGDAIELALPAESTTPVSYRVRLAAPPWPSPVYLSPVIDVPYTYHGLREVNRYQLGPQQFAIRGPTGVQIHLTLSAGARRERAARYPVVAAGHTVHIAGTTDPKVSDAPIEVGYRSTTGAAHGTIGTASTDQTGGFHIAWTPPTPDTYTITSAYLHPSHGYLADRNCDLALVVR